MENCVYPDKKLCKQLFYSSLITSIPGIYALKKGYYFEGYMSFFIVFTSLNFWKNPRFFSWERSLDKIVVILALIYLFFFFTQSKFVKHFHKFLIFGIICYFLSNYYLKKKEWTISANLHMLMHISINIGIFLLYAGHYKPF